ncbi:hypothetical protein Bpfe_030602 [Biomphalaria pfeifferi]|uniref:Uncharacterized protein n=1 Tax=Biomphalaria pfeifferi TaxID=112525 RepID=A0AAD8EUK3_BIOPF|nr:hypothetical protein Bpfe_030602 [Biomphalaria pfeifferi]
MSLIYNHFCGADCLPHNDSSRSGHHPDCHLPCPGPGKLHPDVIVDWRITLLVLFFVAAWLLNLQFGSSSIS